MDEPGRTRPRVHSSILPLDGNDWHDYPLPANEWRWRQVWKQDPSAAARRVPATVPGHVQSALLAAGELPHPYQGENSRLWEWTAARDWVYTRTVVPPAEWEGACLWLRFEGIDGAAHLYLNGEPAGSHDASFVAAEFDVTGKIRPGEENRLLLVVERAPDVQGQIGWSAREPHWRARFAYGWDFTPRLPGVGIWDSVSLRATGPASFREVALHTNLSLDRGEAAVSVVSEFRATRRTPATITAEVLQDGVPVTGAQDPVTLFQDDTSLVQSLRIPGVALWWPNGAGRQPLYQARLTLQDRGGRLLDQRIVPFGVRSLELQANEGAPPNCLPYTLVVNGRRLFITGWNWAPPDLLYGAVGPERYEQLLTLARDAGVNLLRVVGVGLLEKRAFYDLCDRFGILVWQEFPLSGSGIDSEPPADEAYLEQIRQLAPAMIARRRNHPSLALWCGGNELAGPERLPLGSDHPALAELKTIVATEDPHRPWLPTSPTGPTFFASPERKGEMHDVHGPWTYQGPAEQSRFYDAIDPLLHSELGCEGPSHLATLRWIAGEAGEHAFWPPDRANRLWLHHGGDWWLRPEVVTGMFGELPDLPAFIRAGQFIQAEGLRYAVESSRRRKWRCSGVMPWSLNEPFPNAVNCSAVDYFGRPKAAYWAIRRAYRPLHVSAAYPTLDWSGEVRFRADIWLHNSSEARSLLNVAATVATLAGQVLHQENLAAEAPEAAAEPAGDLDWRFPPEFAEPFVLHLEVIDEEGERLAENAYLFSRAPAPIFAGLLAAPQAELAVERAEGVVIRNTGSAPALFVEVEGKEGLEPYPDDSWFVLLPGAEREVSLRGEGGVRVTAWNVGEVWV